MTWIMPTKEIITKDWEESLQNVINYIERFDCNPALSYKCDQTFVHILKVLNHWDGEYVESARWTQIDALRFINALTEHYINQHN